VFKRVLTIKILLREVKYIIFSCVSGVDGKIHPEGVVQQRGWRGLPSTPETHDRYFLFHILFQLFIWWIKQYTNRANYFFIIVQRERSDISFNTITTCDVVSTKIKSSEVRSCVFSIIFWYLIRSLWQYYKCVNRSQIKLFFVKTQDCLSGIACQNG